MAVDKGVNFRIRATNETGPAIRGVAAGLRNVNREIYTGSPLMKSWNAGLNSNRRAIQQLGFQVGDFATQIAGGQSAMLAFTQQGGQMLQFFGPFGAVMAALLAVFGSLTIALNRSGASLTALAPALMLTSDQIRMIADAWHWLGQSLLTVANLIVNHLSAIMGAAAVVATFFAVKWVAAFVSARLATVAFVAAMEVARARMVLATVAAAEYRAMLWMMNIPLGVYVAAVTSATTATIAWTVAQMRAAVALLTLRNAAYALWVIVGGALIESLARLTATLVVSLGRALVTAYVGFINLSAAIIASVVPAVTASNASLWTFITTLTLARVQAIALAAAASVLRIAFLAYAAVTSLAAIGQAALNIALVAGRVAVVAVTVALRGLALAIAATGIGALIVLLGLAIEAMMRIAKATGGLGNGFRLLGDLAVAAWDYIVAQAGTVPDRLRIVWNNIAIGFIGMVNSLRLAWYKFLVSISQSVLSAGWDDVAAKIGGAAEAVGGAIDAGESSIAAYGEANTKLARSVASETGAAADAVTDAWGRVKQAWVDGGSAIDLGDMFGGAGAGDGGGGGGAADKIKKQADEIKKIFEDMQSTIADSISSSFKGLLKGTKSIGEALTDILGSILDKIIDIIAQPIFNSIAGSMSGMILGSLGLPSFEGGTSHTFSGPRAGGVDGRGGRLAVLHSDEAVIDKRGGGGSGGTVIKMTVNTPDAASFRASRRQIEQQLRGAVK